MSDLLGQHSCHSTQDHRRDMVRIRSSPPESNTIKSQKYLHVTACPAVTANRAHQFPSSSPTTRRPPHSNTTNQPTHPAAGRQPHHRSIDRPGCTSGPETPPPGTDSIFPFELETKHGQPSNPPAGRPSDRPPSCNNAGRPSRNPSTPPPGLGQPAKRPRKTPHVAFTLQCLGVYKYLHTGILYFAKLEYHTMS